MTSTPRKLGWFAAALSLLVPAQALHADHGPQGESTASAPTTRKSTREDPANPVALIKTNHGDIYLELFVKEAPKTVGNFLDLANGKKEFDTAKPVTVPKKVGDEADESGTKKARRPFYDGLIFHRVIKGFMIQGGCPLGNGTGSPGYKFEDEINATALGLDKIKAFEEQKGPHQWLGIRSRHDWQQRVMVPIFQKLKITSQKDLDKRIEEVKTTLNALTLKEAYENQGYRYDEKLGSHKPVRGCIAMANSGPNTNGSQFFINLVDTPHLTGKHTVFGMVIEGMDVVDKIGAVEVDQGAKPTKAVTIVSIREFDYAEGRK